MGTHAISLREMQVGEKGVIACVAARGELGRRMRDMGLVPGASIEVIGRAPLRDPVAVRLQGFTLTLRNNEADRISVTLLDERESGKKQAADEEGCG